MAVLDSTDPAEVLKIERENPLEQTLYIVASKSGTTAETSAYGEYFYDKAREKLGDQAGGHFIVITDPGTPLEDLAVRRGYRRVFRNFADIGGRYSALSYFGLLPAALMGLDVSELLERALRMANACAAGVPAWENPGLVLGAGLGEMALAGRDKLTFLAPPEISALGLWLEQLLAESTGKEGKGILPVAGEPIGAPASYDSDRCFVVFRLKGAADPEFERGVEELSSAGFPMVAILLEDRMDIAQEFFRWEVATAAAGAVLGINAFDQPNVRESKVNTNALLKTVRSTGALPAERIPVVSLARPVSTAGRGTIRELSGSGDAGGLSCPPGVPARNPRNRPDAAADPPAPARPVPHRDDRRVRAAVPAFAPASITRADRTPESSCS